MAIGNSYLKEIEDKRLLAIDIIENGTFWPLFVIHNKEHNNEVFKGSHRVLSAQLLNDEGGWNGRRFLALDFIVPVEETIWDFYSKKEKLRGDDMYRVPVSLLYPDMYKDNYDLDEIKKDIEFHGGKLIDNDVAEIPMRSYRDLLKCITYLGIWLSELIYMNKDITGEYLKASPIINDEEYFKEWISEAKSYE